VSTQDKVGTDAGRLCGTTDVGLMATGDLSTVLALARPSIVSRQARANRS
jgi:hypothetical protein